MADYMTLAAVLMVSTFVWALPVAVVSTNPRLSVMQKALWIVGTLVLSWIALVLYAAFAPLDKLDAG